VLEKLEIFGWKWWNSAIHSSSIHSTPRPTSKPAGVNTFTVPAGTLRGSFSHFVVFSRSVPLMQVELFRGNFKSWES